MVGALLLWFVNLTWLTFFLIALLVAGWQVLVARLALRAQVLVEPEPGPDDAPPSSPPTSPTTGEPVAS